MVVGRDVRLELFAQIRRDARVDGTGIRALARKYGVGRGTVRLALQSAEPPARKVPVRATPKLDLVRDLIDEMLRQDLDAPRKQRQTATRIWARLLDEQQVETSYATVRDYVRTRRARRGSGPRLGRVRSAVARTGRGGRG